MEMVILNLLVQIVPSLGVSIIFVVRLEGKINLLSSELKHLENKIEQSLIVQDKNISKLQEKIQGHERCLGKLIEFINVDRASQKQPIFKVSKYDFQED